MEFLFDPDAPHPISLPPLSPDDPHSIKPLGAGLTAWDLPRKLPKGLEAQADAQGRAVAFLKQCVAEAEDVDWVQATPPVFGAPGALDPRGGSGEAGDADAAREGGTVWLDRAFNLESFPAFGAGSSAFGGSEEGEGDQEQEQEVEVEVEMEGGLEFMDLGVGADSLQGGLFGTPYLRGDGEADAAGAGFGAGGRGRTGGLVRGVSQMAMG